MKRILLIDDDGFFANQCIVILERIGFQVKWISRPEEVLRMDNLHRDYDAALVDYQFDNSQLTGEDLGDLLPRNWDLLPRILLTAFLRDPLIEKAGRPSWDGLMEKKSPGETGYELPAFYKSKIEEALAHAQKRIAQDYSYSEERYRELELRLDALEWACQERIVSQKWKHPQNFNCKDLAWTACLYHSDPLRGELTTEEVTLLKTLQSKGKVTPAIKNEWLQRQVKMTTENNWPPYFRIREKSPKISSWDLGRLAMEGFTTRQLLLDFPDRWPLTRIHYDAVANVVKEFGLRAPPL